MFKLVDYYQLNNLKEIIRSKLPLVYYYYGSSKRYMGTAATDPKRKNEDRMEKKENKSFVMNLFLGKSVTEQLFPFPNYLTIDEVQSLEMLVNEADKFFIECNDASINDSQEAIAEPTLEGLKQLGCFGLQIPTELGGVGLNNTQYARLVEICGGHDLSIGVMLGAHQSIGLKGILIAGNDEQKKKYLPDLATGKHVACFALTEPSSGSDAGSIRSRAIPSPDGRHYILNGSKIWITNGGFAEIFTVFAQTPVKSERTGEVRDKVTAFIVERSFGGVSNGLPEKKMGIKGTKSVEVYFENVEVPVENILGGLGNGFKVAMEILNNGRFGMAAAMTGTIRIAIQKAVEFASNREQFGRKINSYGTIQEKIARMTMFHYVSESLAYMISGNMDNGSKDYHLEAAVSKIFASEAAWHSVDEAIQILGGMGYMKDYGLERVMRDLRIFRIFEGTNDILRLFIALTGLQHAGGHLKALQKAMKNPAVNLGLIFNEGSKRVQKAVGIIQFSQLEGVHPNLSHSANQLSKCINMFGNEIENILIKYGKNIIENQFILNRIANSAIDIYTSAVVLSRASSSLTKNSFSASHEQKLATVWVNEATNRINNNLIATSSKISISNFSDMESISQDICDNGGVIVHRPLNV